MMYLFCVRHFNDIDHITPVAWKMKQSNHPVAVYCINPKYDIQNDYRLKFLQDQGVIVESIYKAFAQELDVLHQGMMGYFEEVLEALASKKDNLQRLLKQFHLNPSKCCLFGDAESDYRAAYACGVEFIGIVNDADSALIRALPEIRYTKDFSDVENKFGRGI